MVGDLVESELNISGVSVTDGGLWSCLASNRAGRLVHEGRLNVRGPPTIRPMGAVSVVAGSSAAFHCVVAGYPIHSIYWEKSGELDELQKVVDAVRCCVGHPIDYNNNNNNNFI